MSFRRCFGCVSAWFPAQAPLLYQLASLRLRAWFPRRFLLRLPTHSPLTSHKFGYVFVCRKLSSCPFPDRGDNGLAGEMVMKKPDAYFIAVVVPLHHVWLYQRAMRIHVSGVFFRKSP